MNFGCCTITRAEIRGAISGIEISWNYGYRQVELQLNSHAAISMLNSRDEPLHQYATKVIYFIELCCLEWNVHIRYVYHKGNKVVDFLASHGYEFPFVIHLSPLSDCNLGYFLRYDCFSICNIPTFSDKILSALGLPLTDLFLGVGGIRTHDLLLSRSNPHYTTKRVMSVKVKLFHIAHGSPP
ncbi:hypothetical protein LINPERHAP1_LOCUS29479 [Linum perenne]